MTGPLIIRFANNLEPAREGMASLRADVVSNLNSMNAAFTRGSMVADAYGSTLSPFAGVIDLVLTQMAALEAAEGIIDRVGEALSDAQGRLERTIAVA